MKRVYWIPALLFALAIVFAGCGGKTAYEPSTAAPSAEPTETAAGTLPEDASEASAQTDAGETANAGTSTTKAGETTKVGTSATKAGETTKAGTSATKAGETTKAGASATKAGETTKAGASTTKAGETTKAEASTTKAGETTKAGTSTTKAGETTTKSGSTSTTRAGSTTPSQNAKGNAVSGKLSYLNTTDRKASSLTSKDLERYGITGSKASQILNNPDDWTMYTIRIDFQNHEDVPITMYYLDVTNNGTGDVFVRGDFSAEIGLGPGSSENELFYLLAKSSDTENAVLDKVGDLSMRLQYAATPEDDDATPNFVYAKVN